MATTQALSHPGRGSPKLCLSPNPIARPTDRTVLLWIRDRSRILCAWLKPKASSLRQPSSLSEPPRFRSLLADLLQQRQNTLWQLIRISEDRCTGLNQNLIAGEV